MIENENLLSVIVVKTNARKKESHSLSSSVVIQQLPFFLVLSLYYNITKTHKTCRKIIVLLFVCGGIEDYSLCTIVSVIATIGTVLSVGVLSGL